jgi:hypothetical protein
MNRQTSLTAVSFLAAYVSLTGVLIKGENVPVSARRSPVLMAGELNAKHPE